MTQRGLQEAKHSSFTEPLNDAMRHWDRPVNRRV
jgi:hypothetical protein